MKFLFVDSCHNELFVLLYDNGKIYTRKSSGNKKHNSVLLPFIDEVLTESGNKIKDIQNIACCVGPGSFTGIRLGVTTCNGIAFATCANRVAINTFESIAYNNINHILVCVDSGHGNYYAGEYDNGKEVSLFSTENRPFYKDLGCEIITWNGEKDSNNIVNVICEKIKNKDFVQMFSPLYLKKSQAEREKDDKIRNKK